MYHDSNNPTVIDALEASHCYLKDDRFSVWQHPDFEGFLRVRYARVTGDLIIDIYDSYDRAVGADDDDVRATVSSAQWSDPAAGCSDLEMYVGVIEYALTHAPQRRSEGAIWTVYGE